MSLPPYVSYLFLLTVIHWGLPHVVDVTTISAFPFVILVNLGLSLTATLYHDPNVSWRNALIEAGMISIVPPLVLGVSTLCRSVSFLSVLALTPIFLFLSEFLRGSSARIQSCLYQNFHLPASWLYSPIPHKILETILLILLVSFLQLTAETLILAMMVVLFDRKELIKTRSHQYREFSG